MLTESDFIRSICERPDDNFPRLLYAEWLEDRGQPGDAERAESIRLAAEIGKDNDEVLLFYSVPQTIDWPRHFPVFRNGFISRVSFHSVVIESRDAAKIVREVFSHHPIVNAHVSDWREAFGLIRFPIGGFFSLSSEWRWQRFPHDIFNHWPDEAGPFGTSYRTAELALAALSRAIVSWGRSLAGLPALQTLPAEPAQSSGH